MTHVFVGNDVVDLTNPRTRGRALDERFVARVFDEDERAAVRAAGNADLEVWCRWAAKEAGFKAISKVLGAPPAFVHRAFKVEWSESRQAPEGLVRTGAVRYGEQLATVAVELRPGAVHAVAYSPPQGASAVHVEPCVAPIESPGSRWNGTLEELLPRFTAHEADAVYSRESAAVRIGARGDLAARLGVEERRVEIVCAPGPTSQRPPRVLLDGADAPADVSLSHDGPWIAWAILVETSHEGDS